MNAFPEFESLFNNTNKALSELELGLLYSYALIKDVPTQKDFALEAVKTLLPDCLFSLRKGYCSSVIEYLKKMRSKNLLELLRKEFPDLMNIKEVPIL